MLRAGDMLVAGLADRLGPSCAKVSYSITELVQCGLVTRTVLNNMTFEGATKNPMQQTVKDMWQIAAD